MVTATVAGCRCASSCTARARPRRTSNGSGSAGSSPPRSSPAHRRSCWRVPTAVGRRGWATVAPTIRSGCSARRSPPGVTTGGSTRRGWSGTAGRWAGSACCTRCSRNPGSLQRVAALSPAVGGSDPVMSAADRLEGARIGLWCGTSDGLHDDVQRLADAIPGGPAIESYGPGAHTRRLLGPDHARRLRVRRRGVRMTRDGRLRPCRRRCALLAA